MDNSFQQILEFVDSLTYEGLKQLQIEIEDRIQKEEDESDTQ